MAELFVGKLSEFTDPDRKMVATEDFEIGVFRLDGEFYAYENTCPHQGGPVCQGRMLKKVVEVIAEDKTSKGLSFSGDTMHIVCPWHGFEFNIRTGRHPGDRNAVLKKYEVSIRDDDVFVIL